MKSLTTQSASDRGVDLRNLNALVQLLKSGEHIAVGPGLCKQVLGGVVCLSLPGAIAPARTSFEVYRKDRTHVGIEGGRIFMNGAKFDVAENTSLGVSGECYIQLEWLTNGDQAAIEGSALFTAVTDVPTWAKNKRFRLLAQVTWENAGIKEIVDLRNDIVIDDVLPRANEDYRVPIMDYTGWSSAEVAGGKGHLADIVRMTEGDVE